MHHHHPVEPPAADVRRQEPVAWLHRGAQLFALVNFAVAGPLLDLFARQPGFFISHQLGRSDAVLIGAVLSLGVPLLLLGLERMVGRQRSGVVHAVWIVLLAAVLGSRVAQPHGSGAALGLAALFGVLAFVLVRWPTGRTFLTVLGLVSVVIPLRFCFSSGVASLGTTPALEAAPQITDPRDVVLIVFDELPLGSLLGPDGSINDTMFPNFASLAASATWYPNAITVAQATKDAVPAILTGRYPPGGRSRQPTLADHPRNLFTLLGTAMPVRAIETASALCPITICPPPGGVERLLAPDLSVDLAIVLGHLVLPQFVVRHLPAVDHTWAGFANVRKKRGHSATSQEQQVDDALALLERSTDPSVDDSAPSLAFVHLQLPHSPWRFLPSGSTYAGRSPLRLAKSNVEGDDPWLAIQTRQRHLLQLGYVDRLLDDLLGRLRKAGTYDQTLLIVVSDHGRAFQPKMRPRGISPNNAHAILPVPLLVKYPQQTVGRVDHRFAETIDIAPTILDTLGVPRDQWRTDGTSLRDEQPPARPTTTVYKRSNRNYPTPYVYRVDRHALAATRLEPAQRLRRTFGQRVDDLYRLVPTPELRPYLDRPLSDLPFVDQQRATHLGEQAERIHVDPAARTLPVFVAGKVKADQTIGPIYVAIAVNGVVRSFTRSAVMKREQRWQPFQAIVPPSCLTPGEHRLEAVALHPPG